MANARHSTEADELAELQQKLAVKQSECKQLRAAIVDVAAERDGAHESGRAGIEAAKAQLKRLRSELVAVRKWRAQQEAQLKPIEDLDPSGPSKAPDAGQLAVMPSPDASAGQVTDEERNKNRAFALEVRGLRHELARWKHQAELNDALRPKQEDEIVRLQAELTHVHDILESTSHAVKHHQVEREFLLADVPEGQQEGNDVMQDVPLLGGGHSNIEAKAERRVREKAEARNTRLTGKVKRLTGVVAAQQLLIQRLEKQALSQERLLEQRETALFHGSQMVSDMKGALRKQSDYSVAHVLGVPIRRSNSGPASLSVESSVSPQRLGAYDRARTYYEKDNPLEEVDERRTLSVPKLPKIS